MQTEMIDRRLGEWIEARVDLLKELHREGCYSRADLASEINKLTGSTFTRGAIIGKLDRLFGPMRPVKTEEEKELVRKARLVRDAHSKRERRSAERASNPKAINVNRGMMMRLTYKLDGRERPAPFVVQEPADVVPLHIRLEDLTDKTCKWPFGNGPSYTFCGCQSLEGKPYCVAHNAVAYQKRQPAILRADEKERRANQWRSNAELKRREQFRQARK